MTHFKQKLDSKEKALINSLLDKYELPSELIYQLLYLVSEKYPFWEIWGAKTNLQKDIADTLEKVITQKELADSNYAV